ncbi:MAG: polyprenyl diphosphate synthase [Halanaerobiales bacterium]
MGNPSHIAIIMDGNGRWAAKKGLPRREGHKKGVNNLKKIVKTAKKNNVDRLTLYAFSTENWKRPGKEVNFLMRLFRQTLRKEVNELDENNVNIQIIGRRENLPSELIKEINTAESQTSKNDGLYLNIAFNYGGRAEIVDAVKKVCHKTDNISTLTVEKFQEYLYIPQEVDLLIRTGGNMRISNFLLWQIAYAELFITEIYWPEFEPDILKKAILSFRRRERRFGGLVD